MNERDKGKDWTCIESKEKHKGYSTNGNEMAERKAIKVLWKVK